MKKKSSTDWKKLDLMEDGDIDFSDIPPLDDTFFEEANMCLPSSDDLNTIKVDPDTLYWFKASSKNYQKLINQILRNYIEMQKS
jgi:uncharacterized protein (DUF4415 family)